MRHPVRVYKTEQGWVAECVANLVDENAPSCGILKTEWVSQAIVNNVARHHEEVTENEK